MVLFNKATKDWYGLFRCVIYLPTASLTLFRCVIYLPTASLTFAIIQVPPVGVHLPHSSACGSWPMTCQ